MSKVDEALKHIDRIRKLTDEAICFYSTGKDSVVCLDLMHQRFKRIVCVFMYFVRDLEHVNRWLKWAETRYPNAEFVQIPHWNLSYILRAGLYSVPNPDIRLVKLTDVVSTIKVKTGIRYAFFGMKKADGMNRRLMLNGYEANGYENKGNVYPLADWTQKDILSYMKQHRLPQPTRYSKKASSGIGFNLDCFLWLREHFPQDLEKIYNTFPMSRRILFEYDHTNQG